MMIRRQTTKTRVLGYFTALFLTLCSVHVAFASDASLFLSPVTGTYTTGGSFVVSVVVSSGGESINAVEGKLEYDPKELVIDSVDRSTSLLGSWTINPIFDNETGELSFAGTMSTGTVVDRGVVLQFTARTLRTGELHIRFATGAAVHAADGTGGNILTQLNGGVYVTVPKDNEPVAPVGEVPSPDGEVLGAATGIPLSSSTHPDQTLWYATSTAIFYWGVPAGTANFLLAFNKSEKGEVTNSYLAGTHEKIIRDNKDGVWYFHITRVSEGGERDTTSWRTAIDTAPPTTVAVSEVARKDASDPNVSISVSATDTLSGIDHYEFILDEGSPITWQDDGSHVRSFSNTLVGAHELTVFALDKAGNRSTGHVSFTVLHLPTPTVTVMNKAFIEEDKLRLTLTSVPDATLKIHIARKDASPVSEEFTVDAKGIGEFESAIPLAPGSYTVSAVAKTANGAISEESEQKAFEVNSSFIGVMKRHPMVPVAVIALILLIISSYYFWRRMYGGHDDDGDDDGNSYDDAPSDDEEIIRPRVYREEVSKAESPRTVPSGAVVLEKKKNNFALPATRL